MKSKINTKWKALVAFSILPSVLFAQGGSMVSGVSDSILLAVMLSVIIILLLVINAIAKSIISIGRRYKADKPVKNTVKAISTIVLIGSSINASASDGTGGLETFVMGAGLFWILTAVIVFLAGIIMYLFRTLKTLIKLQGGESFEDEEKSSVFDAINASLTDNVSIEDESNVMLDHDYDGIKELDNNLPPWWKWMFYGTIIFAFVYMFRYHITGGGQLQDEEYLTEMAEAAVEKEATMAEAGDQVTEDNVELLISEADIAKGAAIFAGNCATCHMADGGGGAGPNLTDEFWIHGGGISNVFSTVKYGVPAKGMIAWQSQFNPEQIQQVSSFILTLQGTTPANGTAPQGEKWIEEEVSEVTSDSTATEEITKTLEE